MLVDDRKRAFRAAAHEGQHRRMRRLRHETLLEAIDGVVVGEFVIVEQDPAQRLKALVLSRREMPGGLGQPAQDRAGLRHPLALDLQHRNFAHRIVLAAPIGIALHAAGEVDADRLPVETGAIQVQRHLVGIA